MDIFIALLLGAALAVAGFWAFFRFAGFAAQAPEDYAALGPQLDLREHLNGPIVCEGVLYGPTGRVASRFVADFDAAWDGNRGTMREHFRYDNGNTQDREWSLTIGNDGKVKATAPDVIGEGTGKLSGPTLKLNYRIKLSEKAGGHVLDTTDWMYLVENGTIVNRSQFRKYGIKVAELVATMRPRDAA